MEQVNPTPESPVAEILNLPEKVPAYGGEYEIKRFSVGQLMQAAEYIAPLGYLIEFSQKADLGSLIMEAITSAGKPAVGLLSVALNQPTEWFDDKDPIESYELLAAIVEKNVRYFFDSGNKRRLDAATARIKAAIPASGPQSAPSSDVDTAH